MFKYSEDLWELTPEMESELAEKEANKKKYDLWAELEISEGDAKKQLNDLYVGCQVRDRFTSKGIVQSFFTDLSNREVKATVLIEMSGDDGWLECKVPVSTLKKDDYLQRYYRIKYAHLYK
jgi:hypothetical protein